MSAPITTPQVWARTNCCITLPAWPTSLEKKFTRMSKDRFRSNADYYKFVSGLKPLFAPGARRQYCNGCYIVLGAIIERISGVSYEKYIEENISKPAGMTATGPLQTDAIIPDVALGYTRHGGDGRLRSNVLMHGASGCAAGGGYSNAADLLAYAEALRHGRIPDAPSKDVGFSGGAPGINSVLEQNGLWTVIVLSTGICRYQGVRPNRVRAF